MPSITPLHTIELSLSAKLRLHTWLPLFFGGTDRRAVYPQVHGLAMGPTKGR